jgi:hypothetical protein
MTIAPSGWDTSPSIRSLIAIAPTIVFKRFSGASTCSDFDYGNPKLLQPSVTVCIQLLVEKDKSRKQQVLHVTNKLREQPLQLSPQKSLPGHELCPVDGQPGRYSEPEVGRSGILLRLGSYPAFQCPCFGVSRRLRSPCFASNRHRSAPTVVELRMKSSRIPSSLKDEALPNIALVEERKTNNRPRIGRTT